MNSLKTRRPANTVEAALPEHAPSSPSPSPGASEPINAHEIGKNVWPAFCGWLTANLRGVTTTIVRDEGSDRRMPECLNRPFERMEAVVLANGANGIRVAVQMNGKSHWFEVAGPTWLRLHYNAAGFVTTVEIGYADGKLALRFTGSPVPGTVFTANSWGE